jgi:hypothetical protein
VMSTDFSNSQTKGMNVNSGWKAVKVKLRQR